MDPVNPWLDPSEVRHLAEQLLRPVAPTSLAAADAGFDATFIGFTRPETPISAPQVISANPMEIPVQMRSQTESSQAISINQVEVRAPVPEPIITLQRPPAAASRSRFLERIHIFRDWLAKNFKARDIFILDKEGKVIFDESGHGRLHFMARNLASASKGSGNIHVKIGPSAILEVIPCDTPYGRIVLGTLVPESLPAAHVQTITEVLIQTASPA